MKTNTNLPRFVVSATGTDANLKMFSSLDEAELYALNLSRRLCGSYVGVSDRARGYMSMSEWKNGDVLSSNA